MSVPAQSLLTIDMITNEALVILHNNLAFARNVNRQYDSSFAKEGAKIGSTLRVRLPNKYTVTTGAAMVAQNTVETQTTITVATQKHVAMNFTSAELTLQMDDFSNRIIKPAMAVLASAIDQDGLLLYKDIYQSVGTPGTTPASALTLLQAQQKLSEMATPDDGDRKLVINPAANAAIVDANKGLFNPGGVIDAQFKRGKVADNILGYSDVSMDQNVGQHTTGDWGTAISVATTSADGDTTLAIQFTGSSKTWKIGDVFTIGSVYAVNPENFTSTGALQQFVVTGNTTGSSTATLSVSPTIQSTGAYQTVSALPAQNATITMLGSANTANYAQNMAYHRDAFTLVTADLELPPGNFASRKVMDGISMRIWRQGDIFNDMVPTRVDVLYGWKTLRPTMACRIWG